MPKKSVSAAMTTVPSTSGSTEPATSSQPVIYFLLLISIFYLKFHLVFRKSLNLKNSECHEMFETSSIIKFS